MADLLVRGVDDELVRELEERAGAHGRNAEAEHRGILEAALSRPGRRSFTEVVSSMPDVGADADFERAEGEGDVPCI
jgi:plasmid stability protein